MTSASSSSSASGSGSATTEVSVKSDSSNAHDTCSWYSGVSCGKPRSCYDCLNVLLTSGECGIDALGECVSVSSNSSSAFQSVGSGDILYSSSNATYCGSDDSTCLAYKSAWNAGLNESTTVCTGTDGCVCLEACESMVWEEEMLMVEGCMSGTDSSYGGDGQNANKQLSTLTFVIFAFVLVFLLMVFRLVSVGARRIARRWYPEGTDNESDGEGVTVVEMTTSSSRRPQARVPKNGPLLHLEGWRSYQEKLITAETTQLQGGMAPPSVPPPTAQEVPRQEEHERTQAHV